MAEQNLMYHSTRNQQEKLTASRAILQGLAPDGGLYVPEQIPALDVPVSALCGKSYQEIAYIVMSRFFTDYTREELEHCIACAYDEKFDAAEIVPLVKAGDCVYMELFHGKTIAFKDMALSILPYLMTTAARKNHLTNEIVILTATSGDTGKAALAGFAEVPGVRIVVFYPKDGVSPIQRLQMVTQEGDNTAVVALHGNFDQAQNGVKALFEDKALQAQLAYHGFQFSSANSINIGRLIPQVVYYVYACVKLLEQGAIGEKEQITVTVPTGNFGNILAAWYAKQRGAPIGKLLCASNENKVLFDFFKTGVYDKNRPFVLTSSPSMDILISSNLERLIYAICGESTEKTLGLMEQLGKEGRYEITREMNARLGDFLGGYATEIQTREQIARVWEANQYVLDPHTAVASYVANRYRETSGDVAKMLIASTASPYKFADTVMSALGQAAENTTDPFAQVEALHKYTGLPIPAAVQALQQALVRHTRECTRETMKETIQEILQISG